MSIDLTNLNDVYHLAMIVCGFAAIILGSIFAVIYAKKNKNK